MYTLRTFNAERIESNFSLGKSYQLVNRFCNPEAFRAAYFKVFGKNHVADLDETATEASKECGGFIYDENGLLIYLNQTDTYYIMSSDGKTFDNLSRRIGRDQKVCCD